MRWRLILLGVLFVAGAIGGMIWRYHRSPGYAVKELQAAYEKQDAARARPFLTARGRALFTLSLDPDNYTPLTMAKTEAGERTDAAATYHFHGLTRFGPLDADLRLVRIEEHWRLDDVFLISVGGVECDQTASSLLPSLP